MRFYFKQLLACLSKRLISKKRTRNAQEKALELSWLFLRAFFPFDLFMFYLLLVTADYKRKTNEINDIWLKCQRKVETFQKGLGEKLVNIQ